MFTKSKVQCLQNMKKHVEVLRGALKIFLNLKGSKFLDPTGSLVSQKLSLLELELELFYSRKYKNRCSIHTYLKKITPQSLIHELCLEASMNPR